jgi:class 3 adenylate cyclase
MKSNKGGTENKGGTLSSV